MSHQPYVRPVSKTTWYMRKGRYRKYMLREVTCIIVAIYCVLTIWAIGSLAAGAEHWQSFLSGQQSPFMIGFHAIALVFFLIYQTFDWFKLAPKAMPIQLGEEKLPDHYIVIGHYVVWIIASLFLFWLAGVFS